MRIRSKRMFVIGVASLALGASWLVAASSVPSVESTVGLSPNERGSLSVVLGEVVTIRGRFEELSGSPVYFYIMSSEQYSAYLEGSAIGALYAVTNSPSGVVLYTTTTRDTYYFVFEHGVGLSASNQTVAFRRTYETNPFFQIVMSAFVIVIGLVNVYSALYGEPRRRHWEDPPSGPGTK